MAWRHRHRPLSSSPPTIPIARSCLAQSRTTPPPSPAPRPRPRRPLAFAFGFAMPARSVPPPCRPSPSPPATTGATGPSSFRRRLRHLVPNAAPFFSCSSRLLCSACSLLNNDGMAGRRSPRRGAPRSAARSSASWPAWPPRPRVSSRPARRRKTPSWTTCCRPPSRSCSSAPTSAASSAPPATSSRPSSSDQVT